MATLNKVKRGQTVTEQIDLINANVENVNTELVQLNSDVTNNVAGYITSEEAPVQSVNGTTGIVVLGANDVGAFPNSSTVTALDINNTKTTGVYIGTDNGNPVYLIVIKYSDNNIYQELIGSSSKKYRRFTTSWSGWVEGYSNEHPVTASDVTGISNIDGNSNLDLALLNNGTFVKADIKYNPSTKKLYYGNEEFATKNYVDEAVNMIHSIIVTELPITGVENTIYYVPDTTPETNNAYLEYVYVNGAWELVGATEVDLTPFLTKTEASQTYATKTENDGKVSKTTTVNGKALSSDITLTASDVGALPSDTPIPADLVHRYDNSTIASMLTGGDFSNGDMFIALDDGTYKVGHIYKYNNGLVDITDIPNDYVDLTSDQSIGGTKNFTGILRSGGVSVATSDDISTVEGLIPTATSDLTNDGDGTSAFATADDLADVENAIPTTTSGLLNDGDGTSAFATEDYVDANGGKIDTIKVNGTAQTITDKEVDISVPTNTNQLTNGAGFITGINSTDVTTALGYAPYNATNPDGYQTASDVSTILTTNGVVETITGSSAPTTSTVGKLWQLYMDTSHNKMYQCVAVTTESNTTTYTWRQIITALDKASSSVYGIVKIAQGRGLDFLSDGGLFVDVAGDVQITNRTVGRPLSTERINFAVKSALTDTNHLSMTLAEQAVAKSVLGITDTTLHMEVVASLGTASSTTWFDNSHTIYLAPSSNSETGNVYDEYITLRSGTEGSYTYSWEQIGTTAVDLSGYVPTSRTINNKALTSDISLDSSDVGALDSSTKYGASLSVSGTSVQLKDQDGNNLGSAISTQDTGATSVETAGNGNVVSSASYDSTTRKLTLTKGVTALTSHQDISGKLDKVSTANTVYGVDGSGNQTNYSVANASNVGNAVAKYDNSGRLKAYTPSANDDVANKSYVDGAIPDTSTLMPKSGGTFTGAVNFPSGATATAEGYFKGTWMYSSNATDNASWTDVWVNNAGWFYKRSKSSFKSDLGVPSVWFGTQAQYDAIANKDSNTYYFIQEA